MALPSRLAQLQAKACEATRFAAKHGCAYQRALVEKNKKYVVEPPTIEKCQELSKQLFYTRLARFVDSISVLVLLVFSFHLRT
jgi:F-type H+-transporting ATPase subunit g